MTTNDSFVELFCFAAAFSRLMGGGLAAAQFFQSFHLAIGLDELCPALFDLQLGGREYSRPPEIGTRGFPYGVVAATPGSGPFAAHR